MSLKSLLHVGFDVTLIGIILAALRQNTGYVFAYEQYGIERLIHGFLGWGEWCYGRLVKYSMRSQYFRKQLPFDGFAALDLKEIQEVSRSDSTRDRH